MPNTIYNVNNNKNKIYFKKSGHDDDIYYIKLKNGSYDDITDILIRSGFTDNTPTPTSDKYIYKYNFTGDFNNFFDINDIEVTLIPSITHSYTIFIHILLLQYYNQMI